jgi:hypothetical protein
LIFYSSEGRKEGRKRRKEEGSEGGRDGKANNNQNFTSNNKTKEWYKTLGKKVTEKKIFCFMMATEWFLEETLGFVLFSYGPKD